MPTAYITGGASGLGRAVAETLVKNDIRVFLADINSPAASDVATALNDTTPNIAHAAHVDVSDWNSQAKAFSQAVHLFERIDYVYAIAGIGERRWVDNDPTKKEGFEAPDLSVLDVDLRGVLYTASLAVQQFRRQEKDENGFRGKSECSILFPPTDPPCSSNYIDFKAKCQSQKIWLLMIAVVCAASVCGVSLTRSL
jgi:NAD(P)-dependent dehydrogenase (short-subunit alcohol dehydrogenase family)